MLNVANVGKCFTDGDARRWVLRNVSFDVAPGQVVAVWGPSGCGKSTLLNLVAGMLVPDEGSITFRAAEGRTFRVDAMRERDRVAFRRRHLGFIFQFFNLVPTLTVAENVRLPLELNGLERLTEDALKRLATLGVAARADAFPETLSGGEQQRVAIARAMTHEPELVLADEPTGNLDADNAARVVELLWEAVRGSRSALLIATHSRAVADAADHVVRIGV